MEWNFVVGDKILLELLEECIIGDVVYINDQKTRLHLKNVYDVNDSSDIVSPAVQIYYKKEIKSSRLLESIIRDDACDTDSSSKSSKIDSKLSETLKQIKSSSQNIKIIYQIDIQFYSTIEFLKSKDKIGLSAQGDNHGRHSKLSLLTFSSNDQIFIFDILSLGKIPKNLKEIIESPHIRKVVHDGRKLADNLSYNFKINLTCVFDTMIADISLAKKSQATDLNMCIAKYFQLPENFLQNLVRKSID